MIRRMDIEQMKEWIAAGETGAVEEGWIAAAEADEPVDAGEAGEVLSSLVAAEQEDLAEALGWALLEERKERATAAERLELAKAMVLAAPISAELRQQAHELYREVFGPHAHFDALVKVSELMTADTPRRAMAALDLCLRVQDGCHLANRFRNQVVQVTRYDATLSEYELQDLADGPMTLEPRKLGDEFELIDETDFRVLSRRDPERLKELFHSDPAAVLVGVCQSREGRIDSVSLKELLVPRYIAPEQWSSWWGRARTAAKRCEKLSVEGRNPVFLVYHRDGLSLEQELAREVESAKTPQENVDLLRRYVREAKQRKVAIDASFAGRLTEALAREATEFQARRPADALAASLGICAAAAMGIAPPVRAFPSAREILASAAAPARAVAALTDESLWPPALDALCELDGAAGHIEALLSLAPVRQLDNVAERLCQAGCTDALAAAATQAVAEPLKYLEMILWLWSDPAVPVPGAASKLEILTRLLRTLHELDIDLQAAGDVNPRDLQRRIRTAIAARDLAGFREVVGQMDEAMASIIKSRIERTDGLADTVRGDMLNILRETFYGLFAKARVEPWEDERVLWTTAEALRRYEAELKDLVEVRILANSRAIGAAAELGDLSENSEWQFAVEERRKLQARQAKMQDDLTKARELHPDDVATDRVTIGTHVTLRRAGGEGQLDVTILGPWDTDLERRRYSYLTAMAKALLGREPGETVTLRLEGDDTEYTIESVEAAEF